MSKIKFKILNLLQPDLNGSDLKSGGSEGGLCCPNINSQKA